MARPLRIEYQGAVYHITSRGDRREPMALDDVDRSAFIEVLAQALKRFDARAWAYCLMGDHYPPGAAYSPSQPLAPDAARQWCLHADV